MEMEYESQDDSNIGADLPDVSQFLSVSMSEGDSSLPVDEDVEINPIGGADGEFSNNLLQGLVCETTVTPIYPSDDNAQREERTSTLSSYLGRKFEIY